MNSSPVYEIPLSDIKLQGINVRTDLSSKNSQEALRELADSIEENGLLQPILLRGTFGKPPYDVVVGQRRFMAHKLLRRKKIKATFSGKINDIEALMMSLSENLHRYELSYKDTENAITKLYTHYKKDARKVAKALGFSLRKVRSYIKIHDLASPKILKLLHDGEIKQADAKRALEASQGDLKKADQLIDIISEATKYEKTRIVEEGRKNEKATVSEIVKNAEKSRIEGSVILNLPYKVNKALKKAAKELAIDEESLTIEALKSWLKTNDYLLDE